MLVNSGGKSDGTFVFYRAIIPVKLLQQSLKLMKDLKHLVRQEPFNNCICFPEKHKQYKRWFRAIYKKG